MATHTLKTWPEQFKAEKYGAKKFEIRWNDRNYQVGDVLDLREYDPVTGTYTGDGYLAYVTYVMSEFPCKGVVPGFVVMSFHGLMERDIEEAQKGRAAAFKRETADASQGPRGHGTAG